MDKLTPSKWLKQSIISGITHEEHRWARIYLFLSSFIFATSLAGVVLSLKYLVNSFYQSGFYQYLSFIFSGDSTILGYWKELSYSLIETIPVFGIIAFLIALGFFIWSGVNTITNTRRFILLAN